jgi:WD40 repeat protein
MTRIAESTLAWVALAAAHLSAEAAAPMPIAEFSRTGYQVKRLEFSPDGKYLIVGEIDPPRHRPWVFDAFSTGSYMAYRKLNTGTLSVWDIDRKSAALSYKDSLERAVAFSADGTQLAIADTYPNDTTLWDLTRHPPVRRRPIGDNLEQPLDEVLVFSSDGKRLATGGAGVRIWKIDGKSELQRLIDRRSSCEDLVFDRGGGRLLVKMRENGYLKTTDTWQLVLFDLEEPQRPSRLAQGVDDAWDVRFSPDERAIEFVTHTDRPALFFTYTHHQLDIRTLQDTAVIRQNFLPGSSGASEPVGRRQDGLRLKAIHVGGRLGLMNAADGRMMGGFDAHSEWIEGIAWSRDGKRLATAGKEIRVWDVDSLPITTK